MKRVLDIAASAFGLIALSPLFVVVAALIHCDSRGPIFFRQERVGRHGRLFSILKFRSMTIDAPSQGPKITVEGDARVTRVGQLLRKTKIDELPQLWNVLRGDMSLVGPRPEVPHYVALYSQAQRAVLQLKPGITDPASLAYLDEEASLASADDPESFYRNVVMPEKIRINLEYAQRESTGTYLVVLASTVSTLGMRLFKQTPFVPLISRKEKSNDEKRTYSPISSFAAKEQGRRMETRNSL